MYNSLILPYPKVSSPESCSYPILSYPSYRDTNSCPIPRPRQRKNMQKPSLWLILQKVKFPFPSPIRSAAAGCCCFTYWCNGDYGEFEHTPIWCSESRYQVFDSIAIGKKWVSDLWYWAASCASCCGLLSARCLKIWSTPLQISWSYCWYCLVWSLVAPFSRASREWVLQEIMSES